LYQAALSTSAVPFKDIHVRLWRLTVMDKVGIRLFLGISAWTCYEF
jgi:hypothetical protein